jgi:flagellar basal-body rod protein FlgG
MSTAMVAAASGMAAQQTNLDTIAENLANADVAGFKETSATFAEVLSPGEAGLGTMQTGTQVAFAQGKLERSGGVFDLAIDGPGFLVVSDANGRRAYTRDGSFARAADGTLRNAQGWNLQGIRIPEDATSVDVGERGNVIAHTPRGPQTLGQLRLAEFAAPEGLQHVGGAMFRATAACGAMHLLVPGTAGGPSLHFGMLEKSNVSIVQSMMDILSAQRAYEANAKGVQAADEMLRIADNLSRG